MTEHRSWGVMATSATAAVEAAKDNARAEGLRVLTLVRITRGEGDSWLVTLAVRPADHVHDWRQHDAGQRCTGCGQERP